MYGNAFDLRVDQKNGLIRVVLTANRQLPAQGVADGGSGAVALRYPAGYGLKASLAGALANATPNPGLLNFKSKFVVQMGDMIDTAGVTLIDGPAATAVYQRDIPDDGFLYALFKEVKSGTNVTFPAGEEHVWLQFEQDPLLPEKWEIVRATSQPAPDVLTGMESSPEPYLSFTEDGLPYNQVQ